MNWNVFKNEFIELCSYHQYDEPDNYSSIKNYWERGYTVQEAFEIWEDSL